jgi:hypothetical protein
MKADAAERGIVRRHGAPAEEALLLLGDDGLELLLERLTLGLVLRQVDHAQAVLARVGQADLRFLLQEFVGGLEEDARAVAGVGFAAAGAAVVQRVEHHQRVADDRVGLVPLHVDEEAHAAGVVLVTRVV